MSFDFNKVFKLAFFDWFKQKGILKYFIFLFVFYALVNLATTYIMYSVFSPLANASTIAPAEAITLMVFFFTYLFALIFISWIVASLFSYFIITKALTAVKKDFVEFNAKQWLRFLVLSIAECFAAMLSIFNLKLLLIPVVAIILIIASALLFVLSYSGNYLLIILGVLLLVLALLLLLAYFFIWIYNSIRLNLSTIIFVEKKRGIMESLKASWDLTKGNVVNIFIVILAIGLAAGVVSWIVTLPLTFYQAGTGAVLEQNSAEAFKQLMNPVVMIMLVPSIIVQTIFVIVQLFGLVAIYAELTKTGKFAKAIAKKKSVKAKRK